MLEFTRSTLRQHIGVCEVCPCELFCVWILALCGRNSPSHLPLLPPSPQVFLWDPWGERERARDRGRRRKEERGAVCLPLTLSLWGPKMGSVSRTLTYCQEENMRTRGRDEKKEGKGR